MERRSLLVWAVGVALAAAVLSVWWYGRVSREVVAPASPVAPGRAPTLERGAADTTPRASVAVASSPEPPPITVMPVAAELSAALTRQSDPHVALQTVEQVISFYRRGLGENPVGQNEDIVTALLGENPKRAAYLPADCPAIKGGKLLDPWGTPYWFHPVSRDRMEIRSAGPDRDLFTSDDLHND
jgi:hypothetical protein